MAKAGSKQAVSTFKKGYASTATTLDTEAKLREIFTKLKINEGRYDVYSVNSTAINEILRSKKFNAVVDWSCIFHSVLDEFDKFNANRDLISELSQDDISLLAKNTNDYLTSLPLEYHFLLPMPTGLEISSNAKINERIRLVTLDEAAAEDYKKANPPPTTGKGLQGLLAGTLLYGQPVPEKYGTYLEITCTGYVGNGNSTLHELDPIYIYKVWFALHLALGNLSVDRSPKNPLANQITKFAFRAFKADKKFASSISRPDDEARLIYKYTFKDADDSKITQASKFMSVLMEDKIGGKAIDKLKNQIVNSLFWYFEVNKTENPNMKTVFFTSVFDSFFSQSDKSLDKARMISIECSSTADQQELANSEILELYRTRNDIIHGERPLLDNRIDGKRTNQIVSARVDVSMVQHYNNFLTAKLNRFGKSVGLIR